jgi:amino-acid N-acetyltransferase
MVVKKDPVNTDVSLKLKGLNDRADLALRRAYASDADQILELISGYASSNLMLQRGPKYIYENIRDFAVVEWEGKKAEPKVIACGSLHVLWEDIAEIRSLAVNPKFQRLGLGSEIVRCLIEEARKIRIEKVFAFTLEEEFFKKLGFKPKQEEALPSKVWDECVNCPKYYQCDETGLIFDCTQ